MAKQTRFYLGRVLKRGGIDAEKIAAAVEQPVTIEYRGTRYSFIDFEPMSAAGASSGFYAKLVKYKQQGAVTVVHEELHASRSAEVQNLIDVASPFVYVPQFSGIAYRHIWNAMPSDQFERVFKELVETKYQKFFVGCDVEPISDFRTFIKRLSRLDLITELRAKVVPPNPLFGPCWKSLSEYLRKRKLEEAQFVEIGGAGIQTRLKDIAASVQAEDKPTNWPELMEPLLDGVGDAAILMSADGYGRGVVKGVEEGKSVVIRTSENQKSFLFDPDPSPLRLFEIAYDQLQRVSDEQGLEHP
ncbi:MAG: hypothetical protein Q8K50_14765 [Hydrogenophaga sp.]|uniref:hypothetical protein n=1 Tax=Hydrogenophaga sp. TaxID=1904254 RepID=UPI002775DD1A|nr:hypothetical protein [Hydrogenophaga sp.]MDP2095132.1 hypothetical protein [Hydrogenophaga sp.]MDZ4189754.1 hypothetical protein [Hydrogenophaga sp.]